MEMRTNKFLKSTIMLGNLGWRKDYPDGGLRSYLKHCYLMIEQPQVYFKGGFV